jgi:hypothetical protein
MFSVGLLPKPEPVTAKFTVEPATHDGGETPVITTGLAGGPVSTGSMSIEQP